MPHNKSTYIVFIASLLTVIVIVYVLMAAAVKETTVDLNKEQKMQVANLIPEGWAFFTRNPKEENPVIYSLNGKQLKKFTIIAGDARNVFGLNRYSRMVTKELGKLMEHIMNAPMVKINGSPLQHLEVVDTLPLIKVPNDARFPLLSGTYVIQLIKPVPWAWAGTPGIDTMAESKIVKIDVISVHQQY